MKITLSSLSLYRWNQVLIRDLQANLSLQVKYIKPLNKRKCWASGCVLTSAWMCQKVLDLGLQRSQCRDVFIKLIPRAHKSSLSLCKDFSLLFLSFYPKFSFTQGRCVVSQWYLPYHSYFYIYFGLDIYGDYFYHLVETQCLLLSGD